MNTLLHQEASMLGVLSTFRNHPDNVARAEAVATSPHAQAQFAMAAKYLLRYFAGKNLVHSKILLTTTHLTTVLNTVIGPGIDMFYAILAARGELANGQDIKYLISVLHECRRLKIPQSLVAGIACVHAQLVGQSEEPYFRHQLQAEALAEIIDDGDDDDGDDDDAALEAELAIDADKLFAVLPEARKRKILARTNELIAAEDAEDAEVDVVEQWTI